MKKKKIKSEEERYGIELEEAANLPSKTRKDLLEEMLLITILKNPQNLNLIGDDILIGLKDNAPFFSKKTIEVLTNLKKELNFPLENLSPEALEFFNYISLKSEIEEIDEKELLKEVNLCIKELKSLDIKNKLNKISKAIKKSEEEKKSLEAQKLLEEFNSYSKTLHDLENKK